MPQDNCFTWLEAPWWPCLRWAVRPCRAAGPGQGGKPACHSPAADTALQDNPLKQLQLRGHDDAITAFAMSPNGALLATGQRGQNADVIVWSTQTLAQQFRFQVRMMDRHLQLVDCSRSDTEGHQRFQATRPGQQHVCCTLPAGARL